MADKQTCFIIAPIGESESETRKRSDQVFKHVIAPAVEPLGYKPIRADQISEPGIITTQVIQHVVDSPLVVADLTGRNPNVFYELAIRHAIKKPLVQLISKGEQIPFDVAGMRTISIDIHDLDSVEESKKELGKQVDSMKGGKHQIETPISVALDLQLLRQSGNPEQRSLADVVQAIGELRTSFGALEKKFDSDSPVSARHLEKMMMRSGRFMHPGMIMEMREISERLLDLLEKGKVTPKESDEMKNALMHLRLMANRAMHEGAF